MSNDAFPLIDDVAARRNEFATGPIFSFEFPRVVAAALAHAAKPRAAAALPPWVCIGPRNVGGRVLCLVQDPANAQILCAGSAQGGLWRTTDGGDTWNHVGGPAFNFPVGALAIHPDRATVLYMGTGFVFEGQASGDGFFRVTFDANGAADFARLASAPAPGVTPAAATDGASARYARVEVDPDDPERLWVAAQTGLWRCVAPADPAAAVWIRDFPPAAGAPAGTPPLPVAPVAAMDADFTSYATDVRIARDPRSSETIAVRGRQRARFLIIHLGVRGAGVFRGRYDRQVDSVTWDAARSLVPGAPNPLEFSRVLLSVCRQKPANVFAVIALANEAASEVIASADNGDHWALRGRIAARENRQANYCMVLEAHPDDPSIVVCGTLNLSLSTDGGAHFRTILDAANYRSGEHAQHEDQHVALFDVADRRKLWCCNDGGIAMARDVLRADAAAPGFWRKRSHGLLAGQFQDVAVHPRAALGFITAGGLQDNGSWFGTGGPSWFHCGEADGGEIALHAGEPRQFLVSRNNRVHLSTIAGPLASDVAGLPPNTDPLTQIPALQLSVVRAPVLADLPLADPWMRVREDLYLPEPPLANLQGPFVGLLRQNPNQPGEAMYAWTVDDSATATLRRRAAVILGVPPAPAALPVAAGALPAPPALPNHLDPFLIVDIQLPAPALEVGEQGSALAFGPGGGALVEGWIGTTRGRLFHTNDAPFGGAGPDDWIERPALPVPGNLRHAANRFAVHPAHPEIVACAAVPAERAFAVLITTAGAPGVAQFRVQFTNTGQLEAGPTPAAPANAAFQQVPGSAIFLAFPDVNYALNNSWQVTLDGQVRPVFPLITLGTLAVEALITIVTGPPNFTYTAAFRAGAGFGPPAPPVQATQVFTRLQATPMFLRFPANNYLVGTSWIVGVDGSVRPGAQLQALPAVNRRITVTVAAAGAVGGGATFRFQVDGLPQQGPLPMAVAVELPATGVVLHFAGGPFVVGHNWTIELDNRVVPGGGAVGTVEVLARLSGRVFLTFDRGAHWTDISFPRNRPAAAFDADTDSLPIGPISSLAFDATPASTDLYAGTLAGVYRTVGLPLAAPAAPAVVNARWQPFGGPAGRELPRTLVNDIEFLPGSRRMRVATFGRGIWDCELAAGAPGPLLLIRQTIIEDGRNYPRPFPPPLPDDPRLPAGTVWLDHAHAFDIRVDSAPFDFFDDRVDGVEFDERLGVDALVPLAQQAVYVQVHNWGFDDAVDVNVHLLFAPAGAAVPVLVGGAAPGAPVPPGLPDPATLYAAPDFNPSGASPWRRVAPPQRMARLKPWEPMVVRFDWQPPAALAVAPPNDYVALVVLCTAAADPLPAALPAGTTLAGFVALERRAALRVVPIRPKASARLFIRDGVDDDARLGGVAFVGRSPDLIVVQAEPANPAAAFKDLLSTRPQDSVQLAVANHVYVRVQNAGLEATDAEVHVWSVAIDALGTASFAPGGWTRLTPAAAPFLTLNVPAGGNALAHVVLNNPADPSPGSDVKSIALVALIRSTDNTDPLPDTASIDSIDKFWAFFGTLFDSDNAALRVLRAHS